MALVVIVALSLNGNRNDSKKEWTQYEFLTAAKEGKVAAVTIDTRTGNVYILLSGSLIKETDFPGKYDKRFNIGSIEQFNTDLTNAGIVAESIHLNYIRSEESIWLQILPFAFMLLILGVGIFLIMRMNDQGNGKVFSFGKSRAQHVEEGDLKVNFDNVAGADEEKEELAEIVDFLKDKEKYKALGARIPKGILLVGPPGTGKTLLAKAVAGEAGVPFFTASGSDFVEMFVGVGASRVRDMFALAKKSAPCIIFIDEIDAVGRQRGTGLGGGHDEREQTLNQLLVEMDGFNVNEGIIVLAATNRSDILDPALLRPGRFDRTIVVNIPDVKGREDIFKVHAKNKPLADDVDVKAVAQLTSGFTGADIENLLNEAALLAARKGAKKIGMTELRESLLRVVAGPEKKSRVVSEADRRVTAYHEAGHAVIAHVLPGCDPVHEVSIIPRGLAAGYTVTIPDDEKTVFLTRSKLLDQVTELLGGRVAEEKIFGDISTGAYNDLQQASNLVRKMITEYGMNDEIGPVFLGSEHEIFIGRDFGAQHTYSDGLAAKIDEQLKATLETKYAEARRILDENADKLERVASALLEKEKITGDEFRAVMDGPAPTLDPVPQGF
ncbi:MAG: ATP-dependent zinc metalloprotease FtsH [Eubacteriales bacterium]|nr:ATP-dependent zinc metalloprotease FtsH [Eubacteriales bacterium]